MSSISTGNYLAPELARTRALAMPKSMRSKTTRRSAPFSVSFVNNAAEIPEELWTATFAPPIEGRWLYEALEKSGLGDQFMFFYALISQNGTPVAVAPLFLMDVPIEEVTPEALLKPIRFIARFLPSVLYQRTLFVGCPCATEGNIGVLSGVDRPAVLLALQEGLEKKAHRLNAELIVWKDIAPGLSAHLDVLMANRRLFRAISLPATLVRFSSQRKNDYFTNLKGSRRFALRKKLKLSASEVDVTTEVLQQPAPEELDEIFALFRQTYLKSKNKFEELNRTWFEKIAELPWTYFIVLREKHTGEMIAFMTCFGCGSRLINKYVGFDYTKPKSWLLYFRLWDAVVDWALAKGFLSIHSGQTTYRAKIEMGHDLIPLVNYIWHRNYLLHSIYARIVRNLDWANLDEGLALFLKAHPDVAAAVLPGAGNRKGSFSIVGRVARALTPFRSWQEAARTEEAPPSHISS
jgi:hypothetical protein